MHNTHLLFDWGNTLMEDLPYTGPMYAWPNIAVVDNTAEALAELSKHYPCHIATNAHDSCENDIRLALQRASLDGFISEIFCYRRIAYKKPQAEFFHFIANHLQLPFSQLIMIGDSLENDIQGAINCGIQAIWLNRNNAVCPDHIQNIGNLGELITLLK